MTSLALAERERSSDQDPKDHGLQEMSGTTMKTGERNNLYNSDPMTQGSVSGSSATALSLHPGRLTFAGQTAGSTQISSCLVKAPETEGMIPKENQQVKDDPSCDQRSQGHVTSDGSGVPRSQSTRGEKVPRKKKYDSDSFFKVNEKLYQKLGKIGSGGSSEVYKVITSDCTIYALKKIILKGRDYPTAYGFCQEIEYLKNLRGRSNIIQLIDYEVQNFNKNHPFQFT